MTNYSYYVVGGAAVAHAKNQLSSFSPLWKRSFTVTTAGRKWAKNLYFKHKKLYYSSSSNKWQKDMDTTVRHSVTDRMDSEEFHFSDEESNGAGTNWGI